MKTSILAFTSMVVTAMSASASTLAVGNITETTTGSYGFATNNRYSTSFTTGSGGSTTLEGIFMSLQRNPGGSNATIVNVEVFSDNSGSPGSALATLSGPTIPITATDPTSFFFSGTLALTPATTYWVVASGQDTTFWTTTPSDAETGLPGWTVGDDHYLSFGNGAWSNNGPESLRFAVQVVPEPSGVLLAGLGLVGLALRRKR